MLPCRCLSDHSSPPPPPLKCMLHTSHSPAPDHVPGTTYSSADPNPPAPQHPEWPHTQPDPQPSIHAALPQHPKPLLALPQADAAETRVSHPVRPLPHP